MAKVRLQSIMLTITTTATIKYEEMKMMAVLMIIVMMTALKDIGAGG